MNLKLSESSDLRTDRTHEHKPESEEEEEEEEESSSEGQTHTDRFYSRNRKTTESMQTSSKMRRI